MYAVNIQKFIFSVQRKIVVEMLNNNFIKCTQNVERLR